MDEESTVKIEIMDSILNSVKKFIGILPEQTEFDDDVLFGINSAISTLLQLGVGSEHNGYFLVTNAETTYEDFLPNSTKAMIGFVRQYLYYKTKLGFDPPSNSFVLDSIKEQIGELEWRMKVYQEELEGGEISK